MNNCRRHLVRLGAMTPELHPCRIRCRHDSAGQNKTLVEVEAAGRALADLSPLLLLGAFLVRMAVDDRLVIAGP